MAGDAPSRVAHTLGKTDIDRGRRNGTIMIKIAMTWQIIGVIGVIAFCAIAIVLLVRLFTRRRARNEYDGRLTFGDVFFQAIGRARPPQQPH